MPSATSNPDPTLSDSDTSDSDFAASVSAPDTEGPSSSNEEGNHTKKRKRTGADEALGSGDEGVVESGRRKKRRKQKRKGKVGEGGQEDGESEEGVGARLKRRREGRGERGHKKKGTSGSEAATIDVDALWNRLNSSTSTKPVPAPPPDFNPSQNVETSLEQNGHPSSDTIPSTGNPPPASEMITIKRTYNFAGTTTTEEKLVPRDSAEARLYLSAPAPPKPSSPPADSSTPTFRRPLKRPSRFDVPAPQPTDLIKATAAIKAPLATQQKSIAELKLERGQKLNTVEKSRLDWAGYVDKEKLKDELDKAEKAKGGYLDKMDFLGRSEVAREEGLREARRR